MAGTGFGQVFLKSNFGTAWEGQTSLSLSVDWSTQSAGDMLEYAVVGFKNTSAGSNMLSLNNGSILYSGTAQYASLVDDTASFLPGGTTDGLDTVGSGVAGSGTFTTSLIYILF